MALFSESFDCWLASDFDAYKEEKWRSNRFNLERGRVRERLISALQQALAIAQQTSDGLDLWTSSDHPVLFNDHQVSRQLALFCRTAGERERLQQQNSQLSATEPNNFHAWLGIELTQQQLILRLAVPRLAAPDQLSWRSHLLELAEFAAAAGSVLRLDDNAVDVAELAEVTQEHALALAVDRVFPRDAALASELDLVALAAWLGRGLHLLRLILGSTQPAAELELPSTSAVPPTRLQEPPQRREQAPAPSRAAYGYRPQTPIAPRNLDAARVRAPIERIVPPTWHPEETRRPPPPRELPRDRPPPSREPWRDRPQAPRVAAQERPRTLAPIVAPAAAPPRNPGVLEPGARVELLAGLFKGKIATVSAIAADHVQLHLGLMALKVPVGQLRVI